MLASLKSLQFFIPAGIILAAGVCILMLRGQVDDLRRQISQCQMAKAVVESNREQFRLEIEARNRAAEAREKALRRSVEEQSRIAAEASERASGAERALQDRLSSIERAHIPATVEDKLAMCERARKALVR